MTKTICNQYFLDDNRRDKQYAATLFCSSCRENKHIEGKLPMDAETFIKFIMDFTTKHTDKGCNKVQLPQNGKKP